MIPGSSVWGLLACGGVVDSVTADRPIADLQTARANVAWYNGRGGEYNALGFGEDGSFWIGGFDFVELDEVTNAADIEDFTGDLEGAVVAVSSTTDPIGHVDSLTFSLSAPDFQSRELTVDVDWDVYGGDYPDDPWRFGVQWSRFALEDHTALTVATAGDGPEQLVDAVVRGRTVYLEEAFDPEGVTFVAISLR